MSQTLDQNILSLSLSLSLLRETIIQIVLSVLTFCLSQRYFFHLSSLRSFTPFLTFSLSHFLSFFLTLSLFFLWTSRPVRVPISRSSTYVHQEPRGGKERDARFSSLQNDSPTKYFPGRMFSDECSPKIRLVRPDLTFSLSFSLSFSPSLIPGTRFSPFPTFSLLSFISHFIRFFSPFTSFHPHQINIHIKSRSQSENIFRFQKVYSAIKLLWKKKLYQWNRGREARKWMRKWGSKMWFGRGKEKKEVCLNPMNFECQGKRELNPSLTKFEQRIPIWTNLNQLLTASEEEKDPFKTLTHSILFSHTHTLSLPFSHSLSSLPTFSKYQITWEGNRLSVWLQFNLWLF